VHLIQGLHGAAAIVLLCILLFAEEAGVPIPLPGELVLVAGGVLIGTGGLDPWMFPPLAFASCLTGSLVGYSWARLVGEHGLQGLADRLHQRRRLTRVTARLQSAGPRKIAISRLIPGLRVYTTLVVGAAGVERRRVLVGIAPATAVWVTCFILLGVVAGVPAEQALGRLEDLIVQGGVLIALGTAGYIAIRMVPAPGGEVLLRLHPTVRRVLALLVDLALLASVVAGVLAVVRPLTPAGDIAGWIDILVVITVIAVFYSLATRRGAHATAGEALFGSSYLTLDGENRGRRALLRRSLQGSSPVSSPTLAGAAERFRLLADQRRLRIVDLLLVKDRSQTELARELGLPAVEVGYQLQELLRGGIVSNGPDVEPDPTYAIGGDQLRSALSHLLGAQAQEQEQLR
jgi:membrane protein DedA with SNARE-associated domain